MPTVAQRYGQHTGRGAQSAAPVVLMVSGGADSTALLLLACTSELDIGDGRGVAPVARERLHVLHVNHHLRGSASDGDEAFVRELCAQYGLPLCVEHAYFNDLAGENLEAAARDARYAAARRYVRELCEAAGASRGAARILTAHTASDRCETFFMNAIKGAGAAGLSSIPRRRNIIVRPLIDLTHDDLCAYLRMKGQDWREDATNNDTAYLRNYVRHELLPVAAERNENLARTVGGACEILGDEDAFMAQLSATALRSCVRRRQEGLLVLDAQKLASAELAIARRMLRLALKELQPGIRLEMRHVEGVLACVAAGHGSLTLPEGIDARVEFGTLALRTPAAREQLSAGWLRLPGSINLGGHKRLEASVRAVGPKESIAETARAEAWNRDGSQSVYVDLAKLGFAEQDLVRLLENSDVRQGGIPGEALAARVWVDSPVPGDAMCPFGMRGRSKKVSDILNEAKLPVAGRALVPVVRTAPGKDIVWLAGVRFDDRFRCTAETRVVAKLTLTQLAL